MNFVVTSITDVTLLDGTLVKQFDFSPEGHYIESIGSYQGFIGLLPTIEFPMQTKCVRQNGIMLWGSGDCVDIVAIEEASHAPPVLVFPNPAADLLEVRIPPGDNRLFVLYDHSGRKVHELDCTGTSESTDVSHLTPGLYYYSLSGADGLRSGCLTIAR
jgi:hypothetical protein